MPLPKARVVVLFSVGAVVATALVAAGLLLLLPAGAPPKPPLAIAWGECPFPIPAGEQAQCGFARAPAFWDQPERGAIEFFFARIPASGRWGIPRPARDMAGITPLWSSHCWVRIQVRQLARSAPRWHWP